MPKKVKKQNIYKKKNIPKALKEQVWIHNFGKVFQHPCYINWCSNTINVFNYHVGHNIPESKGGKLCLNNLKPLCSRCNYSMGSQYSITEWTKFQKSKRKSCCCIC